MDGTFETPGRRNPWVRTVRQVDRGAEYPRVKRRSRVRGGKLYEEHEQIVLTAEVSGDEGFLSVEPGESHRETFEFVVASDIDSGIIYTYFYNPQRSLRPRTAEGWYATAMYDITRKA